MQIEGIAGSESDERPMYKYNLTFIAVMLSMFSISSALDVRSSLCDNGQSLPVWEQGSLIQNETVLFREDTSGGYYANLLFEPDEIISVRAVNGTVEYDVGMFTINGRSISIKGKILHLDESEVYPTDSASGTQPHIEVGRLIKYGERDTFHSKQVNVTYTTSSDWDGPLPSSQCKYLQRFNQRLAESSTVKIVLLGDSISHGANASATTPVFPNQPPYIELVANRLGSQCKSSIEVANLSVGGKNIFWAESQVGSVVKENPDLVIIAFGMNDASSDMSVRDFVITLSRIIDAIKTSDSDAEFLVVSGITPNPDWSMSKMDRRQPFHQAMRVYCDENDVAFCDVYSVWNYLVDRKGYLSLSGNGVNHPNDYGHRLYADIILKAITK
ncbi:SGNH/GDSL hydrolase family protein [Ruficoccus amylovorans]|uniref:SGNH/GDSL hydrolase family protein n=1 Tax=Ruficoccus amylovorans TaxID=1804625 RepID=A0A842HCI2_9BACT|nr:SGNH/GDSL hydrolase family protein [Ruficoccus amylovorans]MBC2593254.1 SGNH/GDSL hydrolase family protein [Ruficoccus amylovorans]